MDTLSQITLSSQPQRNWNILTPPKPLRTIWKSLQHSSPKAMANKQKVSTHNGLFILNMLTHLLWIPFAAYVKSNTVVGDSKHTAGVVLAEIVVGNIPVKNGVVHLIHRPLMVVDTTVAKFLEVCKNVTSFSLPLFLLFPSLKKTGENERRKKKKNFFSFMNIERDFSSLTVLNVSIF